MQQQGDIDLEIHRQARALADRAIRHADLQARELGNEIGGGLWGDDASDYLYQRKTTVSRPAYMLACQMISQPRPLR